MRRLALVPLLVLASCGRPEPARSAADAAVVAPAPAPGAAPASSSAPAPPPPADPGALPQTRDRPRADGSAFDARVAALWAGIVTDDPGRALPAFFPLSAYRQVKAVRDPERDWRRRLVGAYGRDLHALHAALGPGAARARLLGLEVPAARARWVEPGEEWNRLGYYRIFGSRLRYTLDGRERTIPVRSLISWRGEWYVVHLSAMK
ncbi:MAG TPA: hypothetical protein VGQ83_22435 [Polyangia bacterium]|jgi:hypothetical protein